MPINDAQRSQIEDAALAALSGSSTRDLVHGFRIQTPKGQVAAVYWGDLHAGNDVEVALADNRITDAYDLATVQHWLQLEKEKHPQPCNVHKNGSDWILIGFRFDEALAFFKRCKSLRKGFLSAEILDGLNARRHAESPDEQAAGLLKAQLAALRPSRQHAVIDLVRRAKIDVGPWYVCADGTRTVTPRSNPAYCYNWAFGGEGQPSLACVWHSSLGIADGRIHMQANIRDLALRLERFALDAREPNEHRTRARKQATRARQLDALLSSVAARRAPLRIIVNEGEMRAEADLGRDSSVVRVRHLDPAEWHFAHYDNTSGSFLLQRGLSAQPSSQVGARAEAIPSERFADQHDLAGTDTPERVSAEGRGFGRNAAVRKAVLGRADGRCELCDAPGFLMRDGRTYTETHHVVPLGEGGADRVWNVASLCPNHHREAHSGANASIIRGQLIAMLDEMYPPGGRAFGPT